MTDFFISYGAPDIGWATWIDWQLRQAGYSTLVQVFDFRPGCNFAVEMDRATAESERTIAVLSPDYLGALYTHPEWAAAFARDPTGEKRLLVPVRVRDCEPEGFLAQIVWVDLVGVEEDAAARTLLGGLEADARPKTRPVFPGHQSGGPPAAAPRYPGSLPSSRKDPGLEIRADPRFAARFQLGPPPADFTGRERELEELRGLLADGDRILIYGLQGLGGVGKTALALRISEELGERYPDGHLLVDLHGTDPEPLSPGDAMRQVIAAFAPGMKLPDSPPELTAAYRSVLRGRRILLLLDNAAGAGQVERLLAARGSLTLVTSRRRFTVPGMVIQDLEQLPPEDARALLLRIAPRIGVLAGRIGELCGHLPLALRLVASTLATRRDLSPKRYAERLAAGDRLRLVETSIALSVELLSPEQQRRFAALAVFPGGFDAAGAAAVWDLGEVEADSALGELLTSSLVDWAGERYRLHDLVRDVANRRLEDAAAQERHAEHYRRVLAALDVRYRQGGTEIPPALTAFERNWRNIQAGQAWAAGRAGEDRVAAELCAVYPIAGAYLLELRQPPRERIRWLEATVRSAREIGDRRGEGNAIGNLGLAYADLGETRRAIGLYEQDLEIRREIGDRYGEGNATGYLGLAYADLGETRRAIELYEQHLEIAREIGDRRGEGNATGNLGNAYAALGETRRAIKLYERRLEIARGIGDRRGEANASWNLGATYEKEGRLEAAVGAMSLRVEYERELGHPDAEKHAKRVEEIRARLAGAQG